MTLRTPRRRISPRTKRRVYAIRNFLKRALGTASQGSIKINSSIAVNVTDLKHKIAGLEYDHGEGNHNLFNTVCPNHKEILKETNSDSTIETKKTPSSRHLARNNTTVIYRSETNCESSTINSEDDFKPTNPMVNKDLPSYNNDAHIKVKHKKSNVMKIPATDDHSNHYDNMMQTARQTVPVVGPVEYDHHGRQKSIHRRRSIPGRERHRKTKDYLQESKLNLDYPTDKKNKKVRRHKSSSPTKLLNIKKDQTYKDNVDPDYITEIIQRQYKPIKLFGRQQSDSQFSAPICRDLEISAQENFQEESEICSCCVERQRTNKENHLGNMRSVCDTKLYNHHRRPKHRHPKPVDVYNDARHYDIIPVKEKSSPKSRRKYVESDYTINCNYQKEIPPSPRSKRPQLNFQTKFYDEYNDYGLRRKPRRSPNIRLRKQKYIEEPTTDISTYEDDHKKKHVAPNKQKSTTSPKLMKNEEVCTSSSLYTPICSNEGTYKLNNSNNLNSLPDTPGTPDKTDKTLNEIKDILKSFLLEIKKDSASQTSGTSAKANRDIENSKNNTTTNSDPSSFNNFISPQCSAVPPFIAPFTNPCCYPVFPMCPMNCMQNGYLVQSPSCTACACGPKVQEDHCQTNSHVHKTTLEQKNDETDELIKQIYKFVSENANTKQNHKLSKSSNEKVKLTTRSVGSHASKHDAQVGTPNMKYYSKSCEALGSRYVSDTYYTTNNSYSDTILERLSLEASDLISDDTETESTDEQKKKSRFTKVMQSIGLKKKKKKKKKESSEEISESESTTQLHQRKSRSPYKQSNWTPYKQNITNYMVHGQEFFNQPPYPQHQGRPPEPQYGYREPHGLDPKNHNYSPSNIDEYHSNRMRPETIYEENIEPSAPPYPYPHIHEHQHYGAVPQVPLCFKEIEVKSIGTQSDRKISFFKKISKIKPPSSHLTAVSEDNAQRNCCTQTGQSAATAAAGEEKIGFWKSLILKAEKDLAKQDVKFYSNPMNYGLKNNKNMADGDMNIRKTVFKKMFSMQSPFSPRSMFLKSLIGRENKFSFGPSYNAKPKMWA